MRRYIEEFFKMRCAADLLGMELFPNAKEVTESMAAFDAVRTHIIASTDYKRRDIALVCVGDGHSPRTGALFALRTNWDCYSIDPALRTEKCWPVKRLTVLKRKVEDAVLDLSEKAMAIIVCVHSHATLKATLSNIVCGTKHLVTIPCCVPHELPGVPFLGVRDHNMWSEKNLVKIWKDVQVV